MQNEKLTALFTAIKHENDEVTEGMVQHLTATEEPELLTWLHAPDADQRWWALRALAHCGTAGAAPEMAAMLHSGEPALRTAAAMALGELHRRAPEAVNPKLDDLAACLSDEDGQVRQVVADTLARCGDDAAPALARVLAQDHQGARTRAAYALRKIASMKAAAVLYPCLNDTNYMVHTYAYEALEEMGLLETMLVTLQLS
jgi:HEAT repeat protein